MTFFSLWDAGADVMEGRNLNTKKVSAADFVRGFATWGAQANDGPVIITNHGRNSYVLVSAQQFENLTAPESRLPVTRDVSPHLLLDRVQDCVVVIGTDLTIRHANMAACDFMRTEKAQILGVPLEIAVPGVVGSFAYRSILQTLASGRSSFSDVPSVMRPGLWLRIETFAIEAGAAVIFRDVTSEIEAGRAPDVKEAILEGVHADGTVGYARISPREMVESADANLLRIIGVSEEAFKKVKFSAVIAPRHRGEFCEALEAVFRDKRPATLTTCFFTRSGEEIPVRISIVELRGGYAAEGAIVVVSHVSNSAR